MANHFNPDPSGCLCRGKRLLFEKGGIEENDWGIRAK
jgi:hypothetical protein